MKKDKNVLVEKFNSGEITEDELQELETLIALGSVEIKDLENLSEINHKFLNLSTPEPSSAMSEGFNTYLQSQINSNKSEKSWIQQLFALNPVYQMAYTVAILLVGFMGGYLINTTTDTDKNIEQLSSEVNDMKEMMLLSLLEKESTSDRLKAVSLTSELPEASRKVTDALFQTLNNDENVNVRLATLEALHPYLDNSDVRQRLIASIAKQNSPLVQVAMAELMVNIQEDRSISALQELLEKDSIPPEIKDRIKESIDILI